MLILKWVALSTKGKFPATGKEVGHSVGHSSSCRGGHGVHPGVVTTIIKDYKEVFIANLRFSKWACDVRIVVFSLGTTFDCFWRTLTSERYLCSGIPGTEISSAETQIFGISVCIFS